MSVFLIAIGAIVAVLGLGSVGYGIPVKEFSFGNTLILAGTTAIVGGLVVVAIGAAIGQMRRLAEILAQMPVQPGAPVNPVEVPAPAAAPLQPPVSFPSRPKPDRVETTELPPMPPAPRPTKPAPPLSPFPGTGDRLAVPAPVLRNPDAPFPLGEKFEIPEHEDVSLSPPLARPPSEPRAPPADKIFAAPRDHHPEPPAPFGEEPSHSVPTSPPPSPPTTDHATAQPSYFDTMWPAETRPPRRSAEEPMSEPKPDVLSVPAKPALAEPVAILKSGVVDGMAYTLYVDGSIEAELPSGTLRFASINELREHLAKSG